MSESRETEVAMKVIADHSRAAAFLIGDGVLPSNEGRGYVLRRIMRRAIRYGRNIGLTRPFLHQTAAVVFDIMKPAYPELSEASSFITHVIENEEKRFSETLDNGLRLLNDTLQEMKAAGTTVVPGDVVFKLYDTFGFPVDIVRDVIRDERMTVDMDGFDSAMENQRSQSRSVTRFAGSGEAFKSLSGQGVRVEFDGYTQLLATGTILVLARSGDPIESASPDDDVEIVTDRTPFYGESGGQTGDIGLITGPGLVVRVTDTIKDPTGLIIHRGTVISGTIRTGQTVTLAVDTEARNRTACNHTATHILHAALRTVLGDHVKQAGSLVSPDRLRFDFTHFSQVEPDELERIERFVNERIRANANVAIEEMEAEEAFRTGAMALFEEKYGDRVRVISLSDFSKELCGGTHTSRTGNIGAFQILSESSVAAGIRRIEAVTGEAAISQMQQTRRMSSEAASLLKTKPEEMISRIEKLVSRQKALEREMEDLKLRMASQSVQDADADIQTINNVRILIREVSVDSPAALRELGDRLRDKIGSGIVVLGSRSDGKALLLVLVTPDLKTRFHAGNIIKSIASVVGGSGGGRPDMAQAGGTQPEKLDEALRQALVKIQETV